MVSTPSIPAVPAAPKQKSEDEIRAEAQKEALDAERNRRGRAETVLTSRNGSLANTARKTLLGE